jgi:type II secretory pathway pseudopilin PulG
VIARLRGQAGITISELVVSVLLINIAGAVFLPLLDKANRSVRPMEAQSQAIDDLRNSLAAIGRELRSARCVYEPSGTPDGSVSGNVLHFKTEANNTEYEVTYTVTGGQLIRNRPDEGQLTLIASGLVGEDDAFTYISNPRQAVKVQLSFQPDPSQPPRELSTVMVGRNAYEESASTECPAP